MPVTPYARLDNGTLDVCLFHEGSRWRRLHLLLNVQFNADHIRWPDVEYVSEVTDPRHNRLGLTSAREVFVETARTMPVQLNGEFVGTTPARFWLQHQVMRVFAPASVR